MRMHDVLELAVASEPPHGNTVEDIVNRGRRVQRARRAAGTGVGATLAVAAVAAAVSVPNLLRGGARPVDDKAATPVPASSFSVPGNPFTFTFQAFDAGRWHVQDPVVASTAYQIAPVHLDERITNDDAVPSANLPDPLNQGTREHEQTVSAYLVLYRPGAFDPAKLENAKQLTVAGRPAWQLTGKGTTLDITHRLLAWEYTPGGWAVLESYSNSAADPSDADLQAVVTQLKPGKVTAATLPFRMVYVPAGYRAVELGSHTMPGLDGIATARDGDYGGAKFAKPAPATTGLTEPFGSVTEAKLPGSFLVFVGRTANSNQGPGDTTVTCQNGTCTTHRVDGEVVVQVASEGRLTDAEMIKVIKGIELVDVGQTATWVDAATALRAEF
ncbi:hypothetical protein Acy02nite_86670 [Actinoplanes cyaneus]|uniref:Uncharacterized protein n=1 Tax=Actinoplanes cyaneus TaxID=52696 RepID=A0A919IT51_9ACTN|nr:hypothetical protein [Actinoplanes cyaneus]MCW2144095.1 hypothetical protein [Actinoplanes cyaneus]GID70786.1 hypothetical protein Acy02nite_86670 [Actinoplanes cyaneus]